MQQRNLSTVDSVVTNDFEGRKKRWFLAFLLIALCALYLATLDTGLQPEELRGGDLITHQYAQVQARPSNAPGYPLYTMGGWLWFHSLKTFLRITGFPTPNPMPLLSSYSTLWALIAIWLFYLTLCQITRSPRQPTGDPWIATLVACFYGVTYFFWYYATTTEQYSSAIAQTVAIVYLYLRWCQTLEEESQANGDGILVGLALLCGLSLAHMLTVAFIIPPLVVVILWKSPHLLRRWRTIVACLLVAMLPLASYFYIYVRGAAHPEWWGQGNWQNGAAWFWSFLSTSQGREELAWGLEPGRAFWGGGFPSLMWQELSLPFLLFGFLGIAALRRHTATLLYGTLAIYLLFCWFYRFGNWYQVILPAYPLILMGIAAPIAELERRSANPLTLPNLQPPRQRRWLILLLLVAIFWRFNTSYMAANSRYRSEDRALDRAAMLLGQPLPANSALFATVDDTLAMQYIIDIWQVRDELHTVTSLEAGQILQQGKDVYATSDALETLRSELPPLAYSIRAASPDWMVLSTTAKQAPLVIEHPLPTQMNEEIQFLGYNIADGPTGLPVTPLSPSLDLTLFWQLARGHWPAGLSISVRPMINGTYLQDASKGSSPQGGEIIQQDAVAPLHGLIAQMNSAPNKPIADPYRVQLTSEQRSAVNQFQIILYRAMTDGYEQVAEIILQVKE